MVFVLKGLIVLKSSHKHQEKEEDKRNNALSHDGINRKGKFRGVQREFRGAGKIWRSENLK